MNKFPLEMDCVGLDSNRGNFEGNATRAERMG